MDDRSNPFHVYRRLSGPFVGEYLVEKAAAATETATEEEKPETVGEDMGLKATEAEVKEADEDDEDDELDLQSVFKFNFVNLTEGHYVSQGVFGENGAYQAVISTGAKPSFTMTIYKTEDGKATEYTTVLAKKFIPRPQPTFMQKFGMPIMMGAMLLMNMAKGPMGGAAGAPAAGAAPAGGAAPAAGAAAN